MNPDLIRWTEDGRSLFLRLQEHCESFPVAYTEFGTYSMVVDSAVAVPSRRVDSHIPLSLAIPMGLQVGNRFAVVSVYGFCIR
jgi:hypothetical protein